MRTPRGIGWLIPLVSLLAACGHASPPERIVLVVVDTLRRDQLSCYGGEQPTPHLDALAARGQALRTAISSFHQTSMSMGSLFTGRTPSLETGSAGRPLPWQGATWCGMARFGDGADDAGQCIPDSLATLAERLRGAGYWTIGIASNPFLYEPSGFSQGFDAWVELGEREEKEARPLGLMEMDHAPEPVPWTAVNEAALRALSERPRDRIFLYVHYMDVHEYGRDARLPLDGRQRAYRRRVAAVDVAVGRLLAALDEERLLRDSVVVVTSDHGERLGERHPLRGTRGHMGNPSYQELLEVPLIVAPAVFPEEPGMVRTQDLFYHLQRIAGIDPEPAGELQEGELWIGEAKFRTYRRGRWKSVVRRSSGEVQLYDLANDPGESRDVSEAHPQVVRDHKERIEELTHRLAASAPARRETSAAERARLRALGYLE